MTNIDEGFLRRRLEEIERRRVDNGGDPPNIPPMDLVARLAGLEEAIRGLRHSQNLTIGATVGVGGIIAAVIIAFGIYSLQRIYNINDRVVTEANAVRKEISDSAASTRSDLIGITTAIANSITAARQTPPATPAPQRR